MHSIYGAQQHSSYCCQILGIFNFTRYLLPCRWLVVELPGARVYMNSYRLLFDRGKVLEPRNEGMATTGFFMKNIIAIQMWLKKMVPVLFVNMLESVVWDLNRGDGDLLQHGNENHDLVDLHYWYIPELKPFSGDRMMSWEYQPTRGCIQFECYGRIRVIQLMLGVIHIPNVSQSAISLLLQWTANDNAQLDCVLSRIHVWILAKVVVQLQDACHVFESIAMSAYRTGSTEGYGLVCCWAYKLKQILKWQVSCLQGKDGLIARYKVSLKPSYSSFTNKVQEVVMSGSRVVTEINPWPIRDCVIHYEEEDRELCFHIIARTGSGYNSYVDSTYKNSKQSR